MGTAEQGAAIGWRQFQTARPFLLPLPAFPKYMTPIYRNKFDDCHRYGGNKNIVRPFLSFKSAEGSVSELVWIHPELTPPHHLEQQLGERARLLAIQSLCLCPPDNWWDSTISFSGRLRLPETAL